MTLLLASVSGADEALIALAHGADIIDLKDVSTSDLAGLPVTEVRAVVDAVAGRRPVSAVAGRPGMVPEALLAAATAAADAGVDYVKIGLHPGPRLTETVRRLAALAEHVKIVGVVFADRERDETLPTLLARCGFSAVMLDTARKGAGGLLDHMDIADLSRFVDVARSQSLTVGLAGSLEPPDIPRLLLLAPDILGFRGALCADGRGGPIQPSAVAMIRELVAPSGMRPAAAGDHALPRRAAGREPAPDHLFVHDFVIPIRIGAYAREHTHTQNVRFNVDVAVAPSAHAADMRDVFSYDLITDGIRIITAKEHISLVEDLAERITGFLFAHPRVTAVNIRIEKLDIGPGSVGVEISRRRPPEIAKVHHLFPAALGDIRAAD